MRRCLPALFAALALIAAAPTDAPEDLIRRANAAFLAGDSETAESLYGQAEERTGDPGLVAFNRAAVQFQRGEFFAAESNYARTLEDAACPSARAAKAWFNRGTCLLRRGASAAVYRSAVACFDRCLDSPGADAPLKADARKNLELAKLLWIEANKKAAKPDAPNEPAPEESRPDPPAGSKDGNDPKSDPGGGSGTKKDVRPMPVPAPDKNAKGGNDTMPGNGAVLQPIADDGVPQKLSPEDTREYLRRAEQRLRDERRGLFKTLYGTPRPGIRDW
ncbi:MAG: hypothetical protein U0791_13310 [Gemmataceae bacterium]